MYLIKYLLIFMLSAYIYHDYMPYFPHLHYYDEYLYILFLCIVIYYITENII